MRNNVLSIALAGALLSTAGLAQDQSADQSAPAAVQEKEPIKEKRICKRDEASMGSRMASRICKTESEWKADAERARRTFEERDKD